MRWHTPYAASFAAALISVAAQPARAAPEDGILRIDAPGRESSRRVAMVAASRPLFWLDSIRHGYRMPVPRVCTEKHGWQIRDRGCIGGGKARFS